ncbi:Metallo-dependent phosphatase-like protein [Mycena sp. CBHHK59/15]|nr:Metallo-dependent phosphatase-like protein [Mycena sp. CBHHK59/15]
MSFPMIRIGIIVQLEYSGHPLPKPDSSAWTRFVLLSDTHAHIFPVPDGDVLLHAGDLTRHGTRRDLRRTMEWLYALPHPLKIIIAGNRDFALDRPWYDVNWKRTQPKAEEPVWEPPDGIMTLLNGPRAVAANVVYLQDEQHKFRVREGGKEWSVFGSPKTPNFGTRVRAFGYNSVDSPAVVSTFPQTDILLTHGPPHGVLDLTSQDTCAGCPALAARLPALRPRLHAFGHIHEARGAYVHLWDGTRAGALNAQNTGQLSGETDDWEDAVDTIPAGAQTAFVNAANWPTGSNADRVGGQGVQPVVVDLLE